MKVQIGSWSLIVETEGRSTDERMVLVLEEDRFQVLSAPPVVRERSEHPIRVMTDLWAFEPSDLTTIIEKSPRLWLAIVHDLDAECTLDRNVVVQTLRSVFDRAQERGAEGLALYPWGVKHGPWSLSQSLEVLSEVLKERWRPRLRTLHLRLSAEQLSLATDELRRLADAPP